MFVVNLENSSKKEYLRLLVTQGVFVRSSPEALIIGANQEPSPWMFDFRRVMLRPGALDAYASLFFERYACRYPFQICGLEVAAIPLVAAIVMKSVERGIPVNGFFIRKSHKKKGLLNIIEGEVNEHPVIIVDDIMNSGASFIQQIEVLADFAQKKEIQVSITEVFSILQFRNSTEYPYFSKKGIVISSLFTLDDFSKELGISSSHVLKEKLPMVNIFDIVWHFRGKSPHLWQVLPKSELLLYDKCLYFGTDTGHMMCLNADTGKEIWSYLVPFGDIKNDFFSSPKACNDFIVFGSYDGNIYALDSKTGKRKWVYMEGDWVRGVIDYSPELCYLFAPLSFGLLKKQGKVVAVDIHTGKKRWEFSSEFPISGGVSYSRLKNMVFFGDSSCVVYGLDAKKGTLIWKKKVNIEVQGSPCIDDLSKNVVFSGIPLYKNDENKNYVYVCDMKTGKDVSVFTEGSFGSYSSPVVYGSHVFVCSLDKYVYSFDTRDGSLSWKTYLGSRCFATPFIVKLSDDSVTLFVGANNGRLHQIDVETGKIISITYLPERIVNSVIFDKENERIVAPTFANDVYSLRFKDDH